MRLFRVTKHRRYVDRYLFTLKLDIVNITLTASRKGGLNDEALRRINICFSNKNTNEEPSF